MLGFGPGGGDDEDDSSHGGGYARLPPPPLVMCAIFALLTGRSRSQSFQRSFGVNALHTAVERMWHT